MKLVINKIIVPLELKDYHPSTDFVIYVWINPTKAVVADFFEAIADTSRAALAMREAMHVAIARQVLIEKVDKKLDTEGRDITPARAVQILATHGLDRDDNDYPNGKSMDDLQEMIDAANEKTALWYGKIWSQHGDKDKYFFDPKDAVVTMNETASTDPLFFGWLMSTTQAMIREHREDSKKK